MPLTLAQALRRSWNAPKEDADLRHIYHSTYAIVFMGTPHRGSTYADWGVLAKIAVAATGLDATDALIRDLKIESATLEMLREEFSKLLEESGGRIRIHTFQESQGLKGVRGLTEKVFGFAAALPAR